MPKLVCLCRVTPKRDATVFMHLIYVGQFINVMRFLHFVWLVECYRNFRGTMSRNFFSLHQSGQHRLGTRPYWLSQWWNLWVSDETYPRTSHEQSTLPSEQANSSSYGKEASPCLLNLISERLRGRGVSEQAAQLVCSSWSKGTKKQYRRAWQKWCSWCSKEQIDPLQATPPQVANFLSVEFGANKSYSTLNL